MAQVVNDENQSSGCRSELYLESEKCLNRHSRIPVSVRAQCTPLHNGQTKANIRCRLAISDKKREGVLKSGTCSSSKVRRVPDFQRLHKEWAAKVEKEKVKNRAGATKFLPSGKRQLQRQRCPPLTDITLLSSQKKKELSFEEDPLLMKDFLEKQPLLDDQMKVDTARETASTPVELSQMKPSEKQTGPYKIPCNLHLTSPLRSSHFLSNRPKPRLTPAINNRLTQLCDMVVARSKSTAAEVSAKTLTRVSSKTQREGDLVDIKLNLEDRLTPPFLSHDNNKGLPRSPSLPCLSVLERHRECPSPALTPSITRSHSLTGSSFQSTCVRSRKTVPFALAENNWQTSTPTLLPQRNHSSMAQNCTSGVVDHSFFTDNFYAIDNELLAIFANAAKPAALRRCDCQDPVSQLLEDKVFLPVYV